MIAKSRHILAIPKGQHIRSMLPKDQNQNNVNECVQYEGISVKLMPTRKYNTSSAVLSVGRYQCI